ncbi:hypothetical protein M3Y97_00876100 [Aphelenchoides bicaudatus]|nr:hypothetical protein M3Y97_00876100 [Aphelenchoides bicaudatus]
MNLMPEEQECITEAFQYYDHTGDGKINVGQVGACLRSLGFTPTEKQLNTYTKQWGDDNARISIQEFMPIYGSLKKDNCAINYDQIVGCLTNFEREDGFVMEVDLRHILENMGERLTPAEVDALLRHFEFTNGKVRITDIADLLVGRDLITQA